MIDEYRLVSALKKMAASLSLLVKVVRIRCIHIVHHLAHVALRRLDNKMIVIGHQHIAMHYIPVSLLGFLKVTLKPLIVGLPMEDRFAFVAARGDVIKRPLVFDS